MIYPVEKFGQVNVYHKPVAVDDVGLRLHLLRGKQDEKSTSIRMRGCRRMRDEGRA